MRPDVANVHYGCTRMHDIAKQGTSCASSRIYLGSVLFNRYRMSILPRCFFWREELLNYMRHAQNSRLAANRLPNKKKEERKLKYILLKQYSCTWETNIIILQFYNLLSFVIPLEIFSNFPNWTPRFKLTVFAQSVRNFALVRERRAGPRVRR